MCKINRHYSEWDRSSSRCRDIYEIVTNIIYGIGALYLTLSILDILGFLNISGQLVRDIALYTSITLFSLKFIAVIIYKIIVGLWERRHNKKVPSRNDLNLL